MSRYAVKSLTMTFGGTSYSVRSLPAGKNTDSEPIDVTCMEDTAAKFLAGALVNDQEFDVVVQGIVDPPAVNTVGDVVLAISFASEAQAATSKTVTIPNCILRKVQAPSVEAGGNRAADFTLTFQPGAVAAASQSQAST